MINTSKLVSRYTQDGSFQVTLRLASIAVQLNFGDSANRCVDFWKMPVCCGGHAKFQAHKYSHFLRMGK